MKTGKDSKREQYAKSVHLPIREKDFKRIPKNLHYLMQKKISVITD